MLDGTTTSDFSDDGEIGAGRHMYQMLSSMNKTETFVYVTRIRNGGNIGDVRFECIKNQAEEVLNMEVKPHLIHRIIHSHSPISTYT